LEEIGRGDANDRGEVRRAIFVEILGSEIKAGDGDVDPAVGVEVARGDLLELPARRREHDRPGEGAVARPDHQDRPRRA
jgi:hypothetical protein